MEASLLRAKLEASMADGISWGMQEDAIEEAEVWVALFALYYAVKFKTNELGLVCRPVYLILH